MFSMSKLSILQPTGGKGRTEGKKGMRAKSCPTTLGAASTAAQAAPLKTVKGASDSTARIASGTTATTGKKKARAKKGGVATGKSNKTEHGLTFHQFECLLEDFAKLDMNGGELASGKRSAMTTTKKKKKKKGGRR